jgi:uncharacterized SAM-binding protein YcdF (DUF218 family)
MSEVRGPLADWRPGPLLPREDERDGALVFVVAVLCFLAGLTALAALASDRAAQGWRSDIEASATVQVRPSPGQTGEAAAARAAEALAGVPGVLEAAALERERAEALLEPWLGKGNIGPDMPIPYLVTVDLDPERPPRAEALSAALSAAGVDAALDDHARWSTELRRAGRFRARRGHRRVPADGVLRGGGGRFRHPRRFGRPAATLWTYCMSPGRRTPTSPVSSSGGSRAWRSRRGCTARSPPRRWGGRASARRRRGAHPGAAARLDRPDGGGARAAPGGADRRGGGAPNGAGDRAGGTVKSLAILLIAGLIWAVGLVTFAERVETSTPGSEPPVADAVVALTGGSSARLEQAMALLERGRGRRLLISGVDPAATREDIRGVTRAYNRIFDCCVDLGRQAEDTIGNARETADWARANGFRTLIVVTADFHMPRSLVELRAVMPEAELLPHAVATKALDARRWDRSAPNARVMIGEYNKYLAVLAREAFLSLGPREDPAPVRTVAAAP